MTDQENPTVITPELKNDLKAMIRDVRGYLSLIQGYEESIESVCEGSKKLFGLTKVEIVAIAKKLNDGKLDEEIGKMTNKVDWMEIAKESA